MPRGPSAAPETAFLLGAARSGTSLLYKCLCLHPGATYVSNWVRRLPALPRLAALNRIPRRWPGLQDSAWFGAESQGYVYGRPRTWLERAVPQPVEGESVFARSGFRQYPWEPESRPRPGRRSLTRVFSELSSASASGVVVSKRIANNRRIPDLHGVLPRARYVVLLRDGRAVAHSLSRVDWWQDDPLWWGDGSPRELEARGADPWDLCARNWVEDNRSIEQGLQHVPEDLVLRVRFEDFVADPRAVVADIGDFVGLPRHEPWLSRVGRLESPSAGQGWRSLPAPALDTITAVQGEELSRYGYRD